MEDTYEMLEVIRDIGKELSKIADLIAEAWNTLVTPLKEFYEILKTIEVPERKSYPLVREIKPKKITILDERVNIHYCRNNC